MQGGTTTGSTTPAPSSSGATSAGDDRASGAGDDTMVMVPDVMGMSQADAEAKLHAAGVRNVETDTSGSSNFAVARVCSEVPGGGHQNRVSLPVSLRYCDNTPVQTVKDTPVLRGLSLEDAKKQIRAAGYTGQIDVQEITNDVGCKIDTVCSAYPERWDVNDEPRMTVYVMKKVTISTPD